VVTTERPDEADGSGESPDQALTPAAKASRAGRNLPAAIAVGVLIGAAVLVALLTVRQMFVGIAAVAVALGTIELAGALHRGAGIRVALWPVLIGGQAMVWLSWPFGSNGLIAAFVVTVLICLLWRLAGGASGYLRDISASIFTTAYVPLFASFATMLVVAPDGRARVLSFLILVVSSDTCGYIAGVLLGRHPMAPSISPKKSWEGLAGALTGGIVAGCLCLTLLLPGQWWHGAVFGVALVLTATLGDQVESLIKRDLGLKDMGQLLPGHGGVMDRLDSLLPSAVVSWLLLWLFVPG
jgi:phosphatidate cytidylyltransferase